MPSNMVLYSCIWCPLEEARVSIEKGRKIFKDMIDEAKNYGDHEGITFLELTEDALRNLPVLMVDNMKCFSRENIDTMVFNIKEIKFDGRYLDSLKRYFKELTEKLCKLGFKNEIIIIREIKITEENIGKTVGRKNYEVTYHWDS